MLNGLPDRIVDAHHHLWDLNAVHYPWLMEKGVRRFFGDPAPIQKNYLADDLRADIGPLPVVKSVHIQVGVSPEDAVKETMWLEQHGVSTGCPNAIIAFVDLSADDVEAQLDRHSAATRLRGVRQIVGRSAEEDAKTGTGSLLGNPAFIDGLRLLAARGLSFDLQLVPGQMLAAAEVLRQIPNLKVALCHAGSLSQFDETGRAVWKDGITALAALPNILCKVSGLGMFDNDWTARSAQWQFESVVDHFEPRRIAFGSNFPVDKLYSSYGSLWERFDALTANFSAGERDAMFAANAEAFYRI
jgi:predicted TIM-barrel fold metal-dependent hydrolase